MVCGRAIRCEMSMTGRDPEMIVGQAEVREDLR